MFIVRSLLQKWKDCSSLNIFIVKLHLGTAITTFNMRQPSGQQWCHEDPLLAITFVDSQYACSGRYQGIQPWMTQLDAMHDAVGHNFALFVISPTALIPWLVYHLLIMELVESLGGISQSMHMYTHPTPSTTTQKTTPRPWPAGHQQMLRCWRRVAHVCACSWWTSDFQVACCWHFKFAILIIYLAP